MTVHDARPLQVVVTFKSLSPYLAKCTAHARHEWHQCSLSGLKCQFTPPFCQLIQSMDCCNNTCHVMAHLSPQHVFKHVYDYRSIVVQWPVFKIIFIISTTLHGRIVIQIIRLCDHHVVNTCIKFKQCTWCGICYTWCGYDPSACVQRGARYGSMTSGKGRHAHRRAMPTFHTPNGRGESRYPPRSPGIDQITEYIWGKLVTLLSSSFSSSAHYLAWRYRPGFKKAYNWSTVITHRSVIENGQYERRRATS